MFTIKQFVNFQNIWPQQKMSSRNLFASALFNWKLVFIKLYMKTIRKEGNVLFIDALNIFYLRLNGVGHMVNDYSDSERGNPLPPLHGLLFLITSKHGRLLVGDMPPPPPPPLAVRATYYLMSPPPPPPHTHTHTFGDWKKSHISYLFAFTVIFTGLIRTKCSHSLPIFRYSEHVQYTEDERKQKSEPQWPSFFKTTQKTWLRAYGTRS